VPRLLLSIAASLVAGVLLAGCGGGDGGGSTTSAADWASGYCSAANTWLTTLGQQRTDAKTGKTTPDDAAQAVTDETNSFTQSIDKLGAPDTPNGSSSETTAKDLTKTLQGRIARVAGAASTNNPDLSVAARRQIVDDQVTASVDDVKTTTDKLAADDAELGTAMKASADCTKLNAALAAAS
jgi:hypothetical protein